MKKGCSFFLKIYVVFYPGSHASVDVVLLFVYLFTPSNSISLAHTASTITNNIDIYKVYKLRNSAILAY